jgi:hypothetical protein
VHNTARLSQLKPSTVSCPSGELRLQWCLPGWYQSWECDAGIEGHKATPDLYLLLYSLYKVPMLYLRAQWKLGSHSGVLLSKSY